MTRYVDVHPNHRSWNGMKRGDPCILPSGELGVIQGMGEEGRIEVLYMTGKEKGHTVPVLGTLLKRSPTSPNR